MPWLGLHSGDGSWAGGEAFQRGTIRLDGGSPQPINTTSWDEFQRPRLATVQCAEPGLINKRGRGMNRIGRDRNCHSYTGRVYEVRHATVLCHAASHTLVPSYCTQHLFNICVTYVSIGARIRSGAIARRGVHCRGIYDCEMGEAASDCLDQVQARWQNANAPVHPYIRSTWKMFSK